MTALNDDSALAAQEVRCRRAWSCRGKRANVLADRLESGEAVIVPTALLCEVLDCTPRAYPEFTECGACRSEFGCKPDCPAARLRAAITPKVQP